MVTRRRVGVRYGRAKRARGPRLVAALFALPGAACATTPSANAETQAALSERIKFYRYDESYADLRDDETLTGPARAKAVPLGDRATLSLGGEYRLRVEAYDGLGFDLPPFETDFVSTANRLYLHADVRTGRGVRVFGQIAYAAEEGREPDSRTIDETEPDIQQAFFDWRGPVAGREALVRVGRQEFPLGSGRLFAVREGPNLRRSFDMARVDLADGADRWTVFAGRPVRTDDRGFSDSPDRTEATWGVYREGGQTWQAYYIGRRDEDESYGAVTGAETRHSVGGRLAGARAGFDASFDAAYQFGEFADEDIRAWGVITDIGYRPARLGGGARLFVIAGIASGDEEAGDGERGTFNSLYPNLAYFTPAAALSPGNVASVQPGVAFPIGPRLGVQLGVNRFWRLETADAVYGPVYSTLVPEGVPADGDALATFFNAALRWRVTGRATVNVSAVYGDPGSVIDAAGGDRLQTVISSISYKF